MADKKISELDAITGSATAATDVFVVVDTSTGQTKKITREELNNAIEQDVLSTVDINGGTIDNTVIGGTTAAAGTFTSGTFTGDVTFGDNDKAIFGAGSDLQIYHDGANTSYISTSTGNMVIQDTDGGTVFIRGKSGENSIIANDDNSVRIFFDNAEKLATTSTGINVFGTVTADGLTVEAGNNPITFSTDDSGYVKVTHPTRGGDYRITTNGTTAEHFDIQNGTQKLARFSSSGDISFYEDTGTTAKFYWDASAERLGIGTNSPLAILDVKNATNEHIVVSGSSAYGSNAIVGVNDVGSEVGLGLGGSEIEFYTGATEAMRIDSSGNVLVGATSNAIGNVGFKFNSTGFARSERSGTSAQGHIVFTNANGDRGSITTNSTSTQYNTTSDYRLKENVTGITDGIERVKQLNPSRFNFIVDADTTVDGFLAHEAQDVVPEAVHGTKDAVDADGNPEYQGIDQSKLVPLLTAALQEAITQIEDLEARVATLEGN